LLNSGAERSEALAGRGGGAPARNQIMLTDRPSPSRRLD
jgi:hypothetical protein